MKFYREKSICFPNFFSLEHDLDIGNSNSIAFDIEELLPNKVKKYKVVGILQPKDTNKLVSKFKEELKAKGVVYPGIK